MTKANIESGFKSCGIFPYNPSIITAEAYLLNYVYSEDRLMTNLFDQIKTVDNTAIVKQMKQTTDSTKVLLPDIEFEQHLITNPRFAVANDHDYLAELITVVEHRSDDLVELNIKTIELKAASNKATSKFQDSFRIMSYSEIEQPIDQHEVDFTVSTLLASDFAKTRSFAPNFPFKNSSYPGDGDNDILPYSYPNFRKSKKAKIADKFFVLTSKEAYESQLKQKQKQAQNEKEKEMRKLKRLQNLKIKEATVLSKDNPRKKPLL
nr:uncharacterized protein LOC124807065 [Hydra vulgaris]XP_047124459.1 uncharacterized protein LOC124807065 [Hydra vulgaris]